MLENTSVTERAQRGRGAGNPFLRCPSVTPHLSSTCAHHVLVRRVREFVAETDVSRENQTRKIDRTAKELAAFSVFTSSSYLRRLLSGFFASLICLLARRGRLIYLNASHQQLIFQTLYSPFVGCFRYDYSAAAMQTDCSAPSVFESPRRSIVTFQMKILHFLPLNSLEQLLITKNFREVERYNKNVQLYFCPKRKLTSFF